MGKYPRFTTQQENNAEYRTSPKYSNLSRGLYGKISKIYNTTREQQKTTQHNTTQQRTTQLKQNSRYYTIRYFRF